MAAPASLNEGKAGSVGPPRRDPSLAPPPVLENAGGRGRSGKVIAGALCVLCTLLLPEEMHDAALLLPPVLGGTPLPYETTLLPPLVEGTDVEDTSLLSSLVDATDAASSAEEPPACIIRSPRRLPMAAAAAFAAALAVAARPAS